MYPTLDIDFYHQKRYIIKGILVDYQDTVKYRIPGYFLSAKYQDEEGHTAKHYHIVSIA